MGLVALCAVAFETQAADPDSKAALTLVLDGMKKERSLLKSGVCRIEGITDFDAQAGSGYEDWVGRVSILSAFDENGQLRFDRTEPDWVVDPSTSVPDPANPGRVKSVGMKKGIVTWKYFRNAKWTGYWRDGNPSITLWTLEREEKSLKSRVNYFDVKALGLYYSPGFCRGKDVKQMMDDYEKSMQPSFSKVDQSDPNEWLLVWSASDKFGMNEWRMWVDVKHGFTPVRYEHRELMTGKDSWWVIQSDKTKWNQQDGVWVPTLHEMVRTPFPGKFRHEITFDVKWDGLNNPISQDVFNYTGFEAPESVDVVDLSSGMPVIIKERGDGDTIPHR
jgi:hypothetical protein